MSLRRKVDLFGITVLGLMITLALPLTAFAQGRGHGRGQGPDLGKKCAKFVNCHDARDGRWDGRGPKQDGLFRNSILFRRTHRDKRVRGRSHDNLIRRAYGRGVR